MLNQSVMPPPQLQVVDDQARASVISGTIALIRERKTHALTLRTVSHDLAIPLDELKSWFPTWTVLLADCMSEWHGRRVTAAGPIARQDGASAFVRAVIASNVAEPVLTRALIGMISLSTTPDHPLAARLQTEWGMYLALVRRSLEHDVMVGREPDTMNPDRGAEQLLALSEGLQMQSLLRPGMDLLDSYDRAVSRLRLGWSAAYRA